MAVKAKVPKLNASVHMLNARPAKKYRVRHPAMSIGLTEHEAWPMRLDSDRDNF
jgi:hypothetical protein